MIRPSLDEELEEAIASLRSAKTAGELTTAANWIKRVLQQIWDEAVR